jgi:hypothetical protein
VRKWVKATDFLNCFFLPFSLYFLLQQGRNPMILQGAGAVALGAAGAICCLSAVVGASETWQKSQAYKTAKIVGSVFGILGFTLMGCSFCYMSYWLSKSLIMAVSIPSLDIPINTAAAGFVSVYIGKKIKKNPLLR